MLVEPATLLVLPVIKALGVRGGPGGIPVTQIAYPSPGSIVQGKRMSFHSCMVCLYKAVTIAFKLKQNPNHLHKFAV